MLYNVIFSVCIIALGLLVKRFPMLIAGYNTMPKAMKANVDIEALSSMMKRVMMLTGAALLALALLLDVIHYNDYFSSVGGVLIVIMTVYMLIAAQKYDHNEAKGRHRGYYVAIFCLSLVVIVLVDLFGKRDVEIVLNDQSIEIEATYKADIAYENISEVVLSDSLPAIQMRTNGYAFMGTLIGNFKLASWGKCKLFVEDLNPPYLVIFEKKGPTVIVALKEEGETLELYKKIENLLLPLQSEN